MAGAFRSAREAYDEHEQVLALEPHRKDAGLIVGTYRYIVATLSLPLRWVAYVAGFGGDRERGMRLDRGGRGVRRRQPDRCAVRADTAVQP